MDRSSFLIETDQVLHSRNLGVVGAPINVPMGEELHPITDCRIKSIQTIAAEDVQLKAAKCVVTGQFQGHSRSQISNMIEACGGTYQEHVTKDTSYVIIGLHGNPNWKFGSYGRKIEAALELNQTAKGSILFLTEQNFLIAATTGLEEPTKEQESALPQENSKLGISLDAAHQSAEEFAQAVGTFLRSMQAKQKLSKLTPICPDTDGPSKVFVDPRQQSVTHPVILHYLDRVAQASRASAFMNCYPSANGLRLDLATLDLFAGSIQQDFIELMLRSPQASMTLDLGVKAKTVQNLAAEFKNRYPEYAGNPIGPIQESLQKDAISLDRRLLRFTHDMDQIKKERGHDSLMLGYPILAMAQKSEGAILAPLFLWPVKLVQKKKLLWQLAIDTASGRRIEQNQALLDILAERGLNAEVVPDHYFDDGVIDETEIHDTLARLARVIPDLQLVAPFICRSFSSREVYRSLDTPTIYPHAVLGSFSHHKESIIRDLNRINDIGVETFHGLKSIFSSEHQEIKDWSELAAFRFTPFFSSDFSQRQVVKLTRSSRNTIVFGPPGTGKSQVIVEIITQAILEGKRVLVCCDKITALQVIHRRLANQQLDSLCQLVVDPKKDKLDIFKSIRDRREKLETPIVVDTRTAQKIASHLGEIRQQIVQNSKAQWRRYAKLSLSEVLEQQRRIELELPPELAAAMPMMEQVDFSMNFKNLDIDQDIFSELSYLTKQLRFLDSEFQERFLWDLRSSQEPLGFVDAIESLTTAASKIRGFLGDHNRTHIPKIGEDERKVLRGIVESESCHPLLIQVLEEAARGQGRCLDELQFVERHDGLGEPVLDLEVLPERLPAPPQLLAEIAILRRWAKWFQSPWLSLIALFFFKSFRQAKEIVQTRGALNSLTIAKEMKRLSLLYDLQTSCTLGHLTGAHITGSHVRRWVELRHGLQQMKTQLTTLADIQTLLSNQDLQAYLHEFGFRRQAIHDLLVVDALVAQQKGHLEQMARCDLIAPKLKSQIQDITDLLSSAEGQDALGRWTDAQTISRQSWQNILSIASQMRDSALMRATVGFFSQRDQYYHGDDWQRIARYYCLLAVKKKLIKGYRSGLSSYKMTGLVKGYRRKEEGYGKILRTQLQGAYDLSVFQALSEYSLTEIRADFAIRGKNSKSLRQSFESDQRLLQTIWPVWLTTPDHACTILPLKENLFDLVVFDEASQCKVEEILPIIVRGKTLIVSGDEHQMPPTRFFQKQLTYSTDHYDDLESELNEEQIEGLHLAQQAAEEDNLLSLAKKRSFHIAMLKMHYRSRSPDLIEFSNRLFYERQLRVVAPQEHREDEPCIEFYRVDGQYVARQNLKEAEAVVEYLRHHHRTLKAKGWSIGVVTLNNMQRYLIWDLLDDAMAQQDEFAKFIIEMKDLRIDSEDCSLFVKNLEEVQGDERDVILVATTFGVNEKGLFQRAFGPIAQSGGRNRLNVLVTRAKQRLVLFTSIPAAEYQLYQTLVNLERAIFYAYIQYAEAVASRNQGRKEQVLGWLERQGKKDGPLQGASLGRIDDFRFLLEQIAKDISQSFQLDTVIGFRLGSLVFDVLLKDRQGSGILIDVLADIRDEESGLEEFMDRVEVGLRQGLDYYHFNLYEWLDDRQLILSDLEQMLESRKLESL
jgi:hypothetical protein